MPCVRLAMLALELVDGLLIEAGLRAGQQQNAFTSVLSGRSATTGGRS